MRVKKRGIEFFWSAEHAVVKASLERVPICIPFRGKPFRITYC